MDVDHLGPVARTVFEFMPGVRRYDGDLSAVQKTQLPVDDYFDVSVEDDKYLFVGMTVFISSLTRCALHYEERHRGVMIGALEAGRAPGSRPQVCHLDDIHPVSFQR